MIEKITLSPSKLSLLKECERCFFDTNVLGIKRPRGIFPSLPGGMDRMMKAYSNQYRGDLPPVLKGIVPGVLHPDGAKIKKWQYWRTAPRYFDAELNVEVYGAIDDMLIQPNKSVDPLDFKTKGSMPKTDGSEYYQLQMDIYNLLFASNGFKINNRAFLAYLWPNLAVDEVNYINHEKAPDEIVTIFKVKVFELKCDTDRAKETISRAVKILRGKRPKPSLTCEVCSYQDAKNELTKEHQKEI